MEALTPDCPLLPMAWGMASMWEQDVVKLPDILLLLDLDPKFAFPRTFTPFFFTKAGIPSVIEHRQC